MKGEHEGLACLRVVYSCAGHSSATPRVAAIVRECSDSESPDPGTKLPWHQRKQAYLDHLRQASPDALLIAAADKLHNARDILTCYREMRDELWGRFNADASKTDHLRYYRALVRRFQERSEAPRVLVDELDRVVTELEALASASLLLPIRRAV